MTTCEACVHFVRFARPDKTFDSNGDCYLAPPTPLPNGTQLRPRVSIRTVACGGFTQRPTDVPPPVREKTNPTTPAAARKR